MSEQNKTLGLRSSLRPRGNSTTNEGGKGIVSFGHGEQEEKEIITEEEKHKRFNETRKKSIKDEFSLVKEMMKNANKEDEDEENDEVKNNTSKNVHAK